MSRFSWFFYKKESHLNGIGSLSSRAPSPERPAAWGIISVMEWRRVWKAGAEGHDISNKTSQFGTNFLSDWTKVKQMSNTVFIVSLVQFLNHI